MRRRARLWTPKVYRLVVKWETLDNHLVDFRNSDDFQEWRQLVGSCFDGAPTVTHSEWTSYSR